MTLSSRKRPGAGQKETPWCAVRDESRPRRGGYGQSVMLAAVRNACWLRRPNALIAAEALFLREMDGVGLWPTGRYCPVDVLARAEGLEILGVFLTRIEYGVYPWRGAAATLGVSTRIVPSRWPVLGLGARQFKFRRSKGQGTSRLRHAGGVQSTCYVLFRRG